MKEESKRGRGERRDETKGKEGSTSSTAEVCSTRKEQRKEEGRRGKMKFEGRTERPGRKVKGRRRM